MKKIIFYLIMAITLIGADYQGSYLSYSGQQETGREYIEVYYLGRYEDEGIAKVEAKKIYDLGIRNLMIKRSSKDYLLYSLDSLGLIEENNLSYSKEEILLNHIYGNGSIKDPIIDKEDNIAYVDGLTILKLGARVYTILDNYFYPYELPKSHIRNYPVGKTLVFSGKNSVITDTFFINDYWHIKDSYYNLNLISSPLVDSEKSSITVSINNIPVNSYKLISSTRNIKVEIPSEYLYKGVNTISIETYSLLKDASLGDTPSSWTKVNFQSFLHLEYIERQDSLELLDFPYPYFSFGRENIVNSTILIGSKEDSDTLEALFSFVGSIVRNTKADKVPFEVEEVSEEIEKDMNYIYIGKPSQMPIWLGKLLTNDEKVEAKYKGLIKEVHNPLNTKKKILIIASEDNKTLKKSADIISYRTKELVNNPSIIDEFWSLEHSPINNYNTLESYGYKDETIYAYSEIERDFYLRLPLTVELKENPKFLLKFNYSQLIDTDNSSVDLYIGDTIVASKVFLKEKGIEDQLLFELPKELIKRNIIHIKLKFKIKPLIDKEKLWVTIKADSIIEKSFKERESFYLSDLFGPHSSEEGFVDLNMVLLDNLNHNLLEKITRFVAGLNSNALVPVTINLVDYEPNYASPTSSIYIGKAGPWLDEFNHDLYIKYDLEKKTFLPSKKLYFEGNYGKELGSGQVIKKDNKATVIISGNSNEELSWALDTFIHQDEELNANAFIIDKNTNIQLAGIREEFRDYSTINGDSKVRAADATDLDNSKVLVAIVSVIIFTLMAIILYSFRWRKKS